MATNRRFNSPYPRPASQTGLLVGSQDLSGVLATANKIGRLNATNDFLETRLKYEKDYWTNYLKESNKRAKAEQDAAAQDLGNEPESESFWDRLGQGALSAGLGVIDVLSRPNFAIGNAAKYLFEQDEERHESHVGALDVLGGGIMGKSGFDFLDDLNIGDIGGVAKAAWEGFSGKEKITGADVIAMNARDDTDKNIFDSKWYQGIAGFAFDVALDPTTYIGAGLVTKPLKHAVERKIDDELVGDLAKANITRQTSEGTEEVLTAAQLSDMFKAVKFGPSNGTPTGLTRREARAFRNQNAISGVRRADSKSQRVARVKHQQDLLIKLREALGKDPRISEESLIKIEQAAEKATVAYRSAVEKYGKKAYKDALAKADAGGASVLKYADEAVPVGRLQALIKTTRTRDWLKREVEKNPKKVKDLEKVEADLAKIKGGWFSTLPKALQDTIITESERMAKETVPQFKRASSKAAHQAREAKAQRANIEAMKRAGVSLTDDEKATLTGNLKARETSRDIHNARKDRIQATVLYRMLASATKGTNGQAAEQLRPLQAQIDALQARINDMELLPSNASPTTSGDTASVGNDLITAKQELDGLQAQKDQILKGLFGEQSVVTPPRDVPDDFFIGDLMEFSDEAGEATFKGSKDVAFNQWGSAVTAAVNTRADDIFETKLEGWLAERRGEWTPGSSAKTDLGNLKPMFGGKNGNAVKLEIDGKEVFKQARYKPVLAKMVTDEDRAAAAKSGKYKTLNDKPELTIHNGMWVETNRYAGDIPEYHAFDRLFRDTHGIWPSEALSIKQIHEGKFIEIRHKGEMHPVAAKDFVFYAMEHPRDISRIGLPWLRVPVEGEPRSFQELKRIMGNTQEMREVWDDAVESWIKNAEDVGLIRTELGRIREQALRNKQTQKELAQGPTKKDIPDNVRRQLKTDAHREAVEEVGENLKDADFRVQDIVDPNEPLIFKVERELDDASIDELHANSLEQARIDFAERQRDIELSKIDDLTDRRLAIVRRREELEVLRGQWKETRKALDEARDEAKKARESLMQRLDETLDLNALEDNIRNGANYVRLNLAGRKLVDIPTGQKLVKATEAMSGLPILQTASKLWANSFRPASTLPHEMNLARLRMQSRTPEIIKHHLEDLDAKFSKIQPSKRKALLRQLAKGAPPVGAESKMIADELDSVAKYLDGTFKVGDETLGVHEVNGFLPEKFRMIHPKGGRNSSIVIQSGKDILKHMQRLDDDVDPMKMLWSLRVGTEQAMAHIAMKNTIKQTFGVKRILSKLDPAYDENRAALVEVMHTKHGWVTNDTIGQGYYFPLDVAEDVEKLFKLTKSEYKENVLVLYDKVLRFWKSMVTVYNPGYYSRNGIGETIMGMFDGVDNPLHYKRAGYILKTTMPDRTKETLKQLEPWKRHQSYGQAMGRSVATLKGGKKLTAEDVWVLYNQVGLKSGFISTEYEHFFPGANTVRATAVGQTARKINDKVRAAGEKYEDYFRMAHFISRLERSNWRDPLKAAEDAAEYVRKYHFDYTDFTPFEKSTMMRLIPFYKWTRKAMPLMVGMIFTNPGKVMMYPKGMTALSIGAGGTDPLNDNNGFMPNYEGIVPEWMQQLMAYPLGAGFPGDNSGAGTFMNVATPTFDIYKMLANPVSATISMTTPLAKVPLEQAIGRTIDPDFEIDLNKEGARQDHLARTTPLTSFLDKINDNKDTSQTWASFLTGLGFYQNSEARQQGELFRQAMENRK